MAERFNLTAQLQLQAPQNTRQVASQIKREFQGIDVPVKVNADARALKRVNNELGQIKTNVQQSSKNIRTLNRDLVEAGRRFSVITLATGTFIALSRGIKNSVKAAIDFERETVKISQVTGKSVTQLKSLTNEVTRLSTSLGVSNAELLLTARTLSQAGLSAQKTKRAMEVLANTTLAPTFDNIADTTEGAIAILNQFGRQAAKTGQDIKFLEQSLDAINAVSKRFAVESSDLITAVRRTGGVFEAAGGNLKELVALFTSVRQTTRESAETIATGFRTIFTRLQRVETIDKLKELGIVLTDVEGKFIGPMKAVEALAVGLAGLDPKDIRFNEIVEQLGGFRQIGKVIPLIKQYRIAQNALAVANKSGGSTAEDARKAQQSLGKQFDKVRETFDALIRKFTESDTFQKLATDVLKLADIFLKFAGSLERVLPQLTALAAIKIGRSIAPGLASLLGGGGGRSGPVSRFASGGMVPGTGNSDSVPAMLTPGEFVIRKKSVEKLGSGNLAQMNAKGYASGGIVDLKGTRGGGTSVGTTSFLNSDGSIGWKNPDGSQDQYRTIGTSDVLKVQIPQSEYNEKVKGTRGKGWEKWLLDNKADIRGLGSIVQASDNPIFPVDFISGNNKLFDAKDKPFANVPPDTEESAVSKALNYYLYKSFGDMGYRINKSNQQIDVGNTERFRNVSFDSKQNTFSVAPVRLIYPDVQKPEQFALGGIAKASKVGAAILESDKGAKSDSIKVGINDIKPYIPGSGFDKTKAQKNFGKVTGFTGKSYTLAKQGLNQATSDNFSQVLFDETTEGINKSVQKLSSDLGLGSVSLGNSNILSETLRTTGIVGTLFESTLNTLQNRGQFSPEAANAPFDFPSGLSGSLADNYSNLPSAWVDAKSSFKESSAKNFKTKIARELSAEYVRSGDYDKAISGKGFATGGSVSDTVPAMLTPGEFVFSKKAADGIGRANLDRMNKQGVQGFASGGSVKRFATAGPVSGGGAGLNLGSGEFGGFDTLAAALNDVKDSVETLADSNDELAVKISTVGKLGPSDPSRVTPTQAIAKSGGPGGGANAGAALQGDFSALQKTIKDNIGTLKILQQSSKTAEGNQAELADIVKVYGRFLRQGQDSQMALMSTSNALQKSIEATSASYNQTTAEEEAKRSVQTESEKDLSNLNESLQLQQSANEQIAAVTLEARALIDAGIGYQDAFNQALKQVTAEYGGLAATSKIVKTSSMKLAKQQLERAKEVRSDKPAGPIGGDISADSASSQEPSFDGGGSSSQKGVCECIKEMMSAGGGGGAGGGAGGGGDKGKKKEEQAANKAASKLIKLANVANTTQKYLATLSSVSVGLMAGYGMLVQSSESLTTEQKRIKQAYANQFGAQVALIAEYASFGIEMASSVIATIAKIKATYDEIAAIKASTEARQADAEGGDGGGDDGPLGEAMNALDDSGITGKLKGFFDGKMADSNSKMGGMMRGVKGFGGKISGKLGSAGGKLAGKFPKLAKGVGGLTKVFAKFKPSISGIAIGLVSTGLALFGFADRAAQAAAQLEELAISSEKAKAVSDEQLELLTGGPTSDGKVADEATFVAAQETLALNDVKARGIETEGPSMSESIGGWADTIAAGAGTAAMFVSLTGIGAPLGAVLGAVAGVAGVVSIGMKVFGGYLDDNSERLAALNSIYSDMSEASRGFATVQFRSIKAMNDFNSSMASAENANLSAVDKLDILSSGVASMQTTFAEGAVQMEAATAKRIEAEQKAVEAGLIDATTGESTVEEGQELNTGEKALQNGFEEAAKIEADAIEARNQLMQNIMQQEVAIRQQTNEALGSFLNNITSDLSTGDLAGSLSGVTDTASLLSSSAKGADKLANAMRNARNSFESIQNLKFDPVINAADKAADALEEKADKEQDAAKKSELLAQATKKRTEADNKAGEKAATTAQYLSGLELQSQQLIVATQKRIVTELQSELVARREQQLRNQVNNTLKVFNTVLSRATKAFDSFDSSVGIASGGGAKMGSALQIQNIDAPINQVSTKQLQENFDKINNSFAGAQLGPVLTGFQKNIIAAKKASERVPEVFDNIDFSLSESKTIKVDEAVAQVVGDLANTPLGAILTDKIRTMVAQGGENIGLEEQQEIIEELNKFVEMNGELQKRIVDLNNQFTQRLSQSHQGILASKNKEMEISAKIIEKQAQQADRMAAMRGEAPRSRQVRQDERMAASQARLQGTGAEAGNVQSLSASVSANLQASQSQRDLAMDSASQEDGLAAENASREFANAAARAKKELEKLADQSARLADIEKDLAASKARQDDTRNLRDKLAFGSDEERAQISQDFSALKIVQERGSLEGINEEGRAAALRALGNLGSSGTFGGQTGAEIKDMLASETADAEGFGVFNDIIATEDQKQTALLADAAAIQKQELDALQELQRLQQEETTARETANQDLIDGFRDALQELIDNPPTIPEEDTKINEINERLEDAQKDLKVANDKLALSTEKNTLAQMELTQQLKKNAGTEISDTESATDEKNIKDQKSTVASLQSKVDVADSARQKEIAAKEKEKAEVKKETEAATQQERQGVRGTASSTSKSSTAEGPLLMSDVVGEKAAKKAKEIEEKRRAEIAAGTQAGKDAQESQVRSRAQQNTDARARSKDRFSPEARAARAARRRGGPSETTMNRNAPGSMDAKPEGYHTKEARQARIQAGRDKRDKLKADREKMDVTKPSGFANSSGSFNVPPSLELGMKAGANVPAAGGGGLVSEDDANNFKSVVESFSTLSGSLDKFSTLFGEGLTMNHTFSGDMTMAFKLENTDTLKQAIASAMTPTILGLVKSTITEIMNKFKSG